ncbi:DUF294 nucleotidyltransferase-like domain-containing protein [Sungkyunkwania multivorans]|uniref:DUF294 nucleotidyltransferase-like domain-containing protein n=1 Tax=Sungkyunkwania multivorans TaxID=1173618 RepID=A0ABW3CY64_9FLAO
MMKNTIAERISDFLKDFPPFDSLSRKDLYPIAKEVQVIYVEKGQTIFSEGDAPHDMFYVVHKGAVVLKKTTGEDTNAIDKCDEGDIFGLRPLVAKEHYMMHSMAEEESILYGIPIATFRPLAEKNIAVGYFLVESFASNTRNPYSKEHRGKLYSDELSATDSYSDLFEIQPARYVKNPVTCSEGTTIKEAAIIMRNRQLGSIVVVAQNRPIGIVTDKDLRAKVATGEVPITDSVSEIMSAPVICYKKGITIAQAQMAMMKHKIRRLCITKDGTPHSKLIGILSDHDILVAKGSNPAALLKAVMWAKSTKELKKVRGKIMVLLKGYMEQNIPLVHVSRIITELNDATIKSVVALSLNKMPSDPPVNFAWISLGSQGRKEQLLHTDQDNAIVFGDVDEEQLATTKAYFESLAQKINRRLHKIGFEYCPAEMMASNPKWCLPLSDWKAQFSQWISKPGDEGILLSSIFFDFDISYGDITLTRQLGNVIHEQIKKHPIFLKMLAKSALRNPSPLGFFRQFLLEPDGEYKDTFDLKARALMPITDAGRVLILSHDVEHINNTAERFEKLAALEPENKETYLNCSYAAKALLKFRTKQGLQNNNSGRYINLESLGKEEKIKLKRCFKAIKEVQQIIYVRYHLANSL